MHRPSRPLSAQADRAIWPFERRASSLLEWPNAVLREPIATASIDANAARDRSSFLPIFDDAFEINVGQVEKRGAAVPVADREEEGLDQVDDSRHTHGCVTSVFRLLARWPDIGFAQRSNLSP